MGSNLVAKLDALLTSYYYLNACFDYGDPKMCNASIEWLDHAYAMGAIPYDLYIAIKQLIIAVRESCDEKILFTTNREFIRAIMVVCGVTKT